MSKHKEVKRASTGRQSHLSKQRTKVNEQSSSSKQGTGEEKQAPLSKQQTEEKKQSLSSKQSTEKEEQLSSSKYGISNDNQSSGYWQSGTTYQEYDPDSPYEMCIKLFGVSSWIKVPTDFRNQVDKLIKNYRKLRPHANVDFAILIAVLKTTWDIQVEQIRTHYQNREKETPTLTTRKKKR